MDVYRKIKIVKNRGSEYGEADDDVAVERKIGIISDGMVLLSLSCTPSMIRELVTGFLLTENILPDAAAASGVSIEYGEEISVVLPANVTNSNTDLSRCLGGFTIGKKRETKRIIRDFLLQAESLKGAFRDFQNRSELFRLTGCFHSAALSYGADIVAFAEDIGRHNAVDKVIGYAVLNDITLGRGILLVSCRISSEIIAKCMRWDIPVIASKAAPTDLSVRMAEESGMTLIGFLREDKMNIYAHPERIER